MLGDPSARKSVTIEGNNFGDWKERFIRKLSDSSTSPSAPVPAAEPKDFAHISPSPSALVVEEEARDLGHSPSSHPIGKDPETD